jgi:ribosomal protein S18 acetylase RimI-like enzyme
MLEDDPAWIALHRLAYQEREDFSELSPGDLRGERACPGFALFVAEEKGQILGYAHVLHLDASEGLINSLVVRESARGRGLGWRLLDRGVDQLWASGVKKISLNVLSDNQHAIDIYDKAGFQSYDEILRYQRREALRLP